MAETPRTVPAEVESAPPSARVGKFVRAEKLGAGGMGEVWKAWDTALARWVALKFIKSLDDEDLARFRREAQLAGRLTHSNIAAIYEIGDADGRPFIAMQLVPGRTLRGAGGTRREIVERIRDAARAVAYANEQGIIHRDLKPDNLMVSNGQVLVMDFGLARMIESGSTLSKSGLAIGTPAYMSPEQARGEIRKTDARSDVYGLGATLYDLLAGHAPFEGSTFEILVKACDEDPRPMKLEDPALEAVVMKALEKEPARRYGSANELADDLDRWLKGEPVSARPASRAGRWLRRRAGWLAAGAAVLVALAAIPAVTAARRSAAARAERELIERMRRTSETCLEAALTLRRADSASGMEMASAQLEAVCRDVMAQLPSLAEPYWRLGRMRRAEMRDGEALALQREALARDPDHAGARYERFVLNAAQLQEVMARVMERVLRRQGEKAAEAGGGTIRPGADVKRAEAADVELDAEGGRLLREMQEDLASLAREGSGLSVAQARCAEGWRRYLRREPGPARAHLAAALQADPFLEEASVALGTLEGDLNRFEESIAAWTRAIERDPGFVPLWEGRGMARISAAQALASRNIRVEELGAAAVRDYDEAIRRRPERATAWRRRGFAHGELAMALDRIGRDPMATYEKAEADFERARELGGGGAATWGLGVTHLNWALAIDTRGGDPMPLFEKALAEFRESNRERETHEALTCIGLTLEDMGIERAERSLDPEADFEASRQAFDAALRLNATQARAWSGRAGLNVAWGDHDHRMGRDARARYESALADYEEAGRLDENHPTWAYQAQVLGSLASHAMARGGEVATWTERAVEAATKAIDFHPDSPAGYSRRGAARVNFAVWQSRTGGDWRAGYDAGLADLERAVEHATQKADALSDLGSAWTGYGNALQRVKADPAPAYEKAIAALEKAGTAESGTAVRLGNVYLNWAEWRRAHQEAVSETFLKGEAAYEAALRRDERCAEAWFGRGSCRSGRSQEVIKAGGDAGPLLAESISDLSRAMDLWPGRGDWHETRGKTRFLLGVVKGRRKEANRDEMRAALEDFTRCVELDPRSEERLKGLMATCRRVINDQ